MKLYMAYILYWIKFCGVHFSVNFDSCGKYNVQTVRFQATFFNQLIHKSCVQFSPDFGMSTLCRTCIMWVSMIVDIECGFAKKRNPLLLNAIVLLFLLLKNSSDDTKKLFELPLNYSRSVAFFANGDVIAVVPLNLTFSWTWIWPNSFMFFFFFYYYFSLCLLHVWCFWMKSKYFLFS